MVTRVTRGVREVEIGGGEEQKRVAVTFVTCNACNCSK